MKEEFKKFWGYLTDIDECYARSDKFINAVIDAYLQEETSEQESSKEVCGTCDKFYFCQTELEPNDPACSIWRKEDEEE